MGLKQSNSYKVKYVKYIQHLNTILNILRIKRLKLNNKSIRSIIINRYKDFIESANIGFSPEMLLKPN